MHGLALKETLCLVTFVAGESTITSSIMNFDVPNKLSYYDVVKLFIFWILCKFIVMSLEMVVISLTSLASVTECIMFVFNFHEFVVVVCTTEYGRRLFSQSAASVFG